MNAIRPSAYDDVHIQLSVLLSKMQKIRGERLIGLYLYGSLVWGGFDYDP